MTTAVNIYEGYCKALQISIIFTNLLKLMYNPILQRLTSTEFPTTEGKSTYVDD